MRFMYIVTSSQPMKGPSPALMEAMQRISEREIKAGRMIDNGGLMPLSTGAQVRIVDGELSVIDGPFVEAKEVIGGYAILEAATRADALRIATEFMELHRRHWPEFEGEAEVRPMLAPGERP